MTTLRVLVAAPPSADRADAWSLFDAAGVCIESGVDFPAAWPRADTIELVLAAAVVRIAVVSLPPLPVARVAAAARFELEDALAGPASDHQLAVSPQAADGRVRAVIAARSLVDRIAATEPRASRIVAEPELAPPIEGWRWCAGDAAASGFVRCADGAAFPVDPPSSAGDLPSELALALAQAQRRGSAPATIRVDADFAESWLARWQRENGVTFVRGPRWHWQDANLAAFAATVDLLPASARGAPKLAHADRAALFKPALWLAGAAIALHAGATLVDWSSLRIGEWRDAREWRTLAAAAGAGADAATPQSARAAIARRYAEVRHAQGLAVPDDALPLLARIGPALGALPPGVLRSVAYADRHWTLDVSTTDAAVLRELDLRLRATGVAAIVAGGAGGARVRIGDL